MRCIVTAGPTYEPLDKVRRLTNFSTGRLGSELAEFLSARGHQVTLMRGEQATFRDAGHGCSLEIFTTTAHLQDLLRQFANSPVDALFHAAAVSDFAFGPVWQRSSQGELREIRSGKFSTRSGNLLVELVPTPKILSCLRPWFPQAKLIGWKYEVDGDRESAIAWAERQLADCQTDACVANGPAYGPGFGLVRRGGNRAHLPDAASLFRHLETMVAEAPG